MTKYSSDNTPEAVKVAQDDKGTSTTVFFTTDTAGAAQDSSQGDAELREKISKTMGWWGMDMDCYPERTDKIISLLIAEVKLPSAGEFCTRHLDYQLRRVRELAAGSGEGA